MDTVSFDDVICIAETEQAILVRIDEETEVWVPQSCVAEDSEVWKKGDEGMLVIAEWFAAKKELV